MFVADIHSHLPCRGLFSWYSDEGHIIHEKIRELLKNNKHKVGLVTCVEWYYYIYGTTGTGGTTFYMVLMVLLSIWY